MSLPNPAHGPSDTEICRWVSRFLSEEGKASYEAQANALFDTFEFRVGKGVVQGFGGPDERVPRDPKVVENLGSYFRAKYPEIWERARRQLEAERLGADELSLAINDLLGLEQIYDKRRLERLGGYYAAYRPFFLNPAETMVMSLRCGIDDDLSRFELGMSYVNEAGLVRRDIVGGRIIPYEQSFLFMGNILGNIAPVVIVITKTPLNDGKYDRGEGVMMVGSQGMFPTAGALAIHRVDAPVVERVIILDSQAGIGEWKPVNDVLKRGSVDSRS